MQYMEFASTSIESIFVVMGVPGLESWAIGCNGMDFMEGIEIAKLVFCNSELYPTE